ncbi:EDC3 isoform 8, partial [Pan troglodytes]
PQNIPKRTDVKSQDVAVSPQQQQCSKSYVDRHMESLSQSKSFRRRHNSYSGLVVPSISYELHKKLLSV